MGRGRWSDDDWKSYASSTVGKSTGAVFSNRAMKPELDPNGIALRESRDSEKNPQSTAIIVALDVTGSMGQIADKMAREGLGVLVDEILSRKPVTDPHIMFMGVGDPYCDQAPLQVTQFEADIKIANQLKLLYIEGGGGGNSTEGYNLPWYFAGTKTSIDCFEKRQQKGYLFTIGDEEPPMTLLKSHVEQFLGQQLERDLSSLEVLSLAQQYYHVFHIVVEEGSHIVGDSDLRITHREAVIGKWRSLLRQNVIKLKRWQDIAQVVVSAIEVTEGRDKTAVAKSWSGDTSLVVSHAIRDLAPAAGKIDLTGGPISL